MIMGVKKGAFVKQRREIKKRRAGRQMEQSRYRIYRTQNEMHTNTLVLKKGYKEFKERFHQMIIVKNVKVFVKRFKIV
ncbi:hypothetical protein AGMMS49593_02310 [Endomicrobiia bacterium]|nr:hypothetical protein AGMMS49593_02310 [Endomicrobiia bacterium]GHT46552.1 hypothetical protein AGMMS49936_05670 [Endomicrobiia bacterium]